MEMTAQLYKLWSFIMIIFHAKVNILTHKSREVCVFSYNTACITTEPRQREGFYIVSKLEKGLGFFFMNFVAPSWPRWPKLAEI